MAEKTGYLSENLKLFHLSDQRQWVCPYHYHDFDKITLFFRGHVSYDVEGTAYDLQPFDIVVIPAGKIHRPVIYGDTVYERIIAYISPMYLKSYDERGCQASQIFSSQHAPILRQPQEADSLYNVSCRLRRAWADTEPESQFLQETLFTEFIIHLSRALRRNRLTFVKKGRQNEKIQHLLAYIETNLNDDLSIPALASAFFMSPDYLMHLFKAETGMTVAGYVTTKRLQKARRLMHEGRALTEICYDCGFTNYSTFYRAWKSRYHTSPKEGIRALSDPFEE
ncbi:AraC family transcriptional regulator [uncultured Megasphaera sp.]|uniref:AraC family transcriptional regulator n=1 Tax=uncultured Megasphaera sp. TaxID=165188 RepID=UPI0025F6ABE4|nr:AraC family transcriptional regulator [uncultured Megasphaera sp.]